MVEIPINPIFAEHCETCGAAVRIAYPIKGGTKSILCEECGQQVFTISFDSMMDGSSYSSTSFTLSTDYDIPVDVKGDNDSD